MTQELIQQKAEDIYNKISVNECRDMTKERVIQAMIEFHNEVNKWRNVEDELPENQNLVLIKSDKKCFATAYLHGKKSGFIIYGEDAYNDFGTVTHWRPIIEVE